MLMLGLLVHWTVQRMLLAAQGLMAVCLLLLWREWLLLMPFWLLVLRRALERMRVWLDYPLIAGFASWHPGYC